LLHTLALRTFYSTVCEACVDVRLEVIDLKRFASGIAESKAMAAIANCHRTWREQLPVEQDLWSWLMSKALDTKLALLAYCVANTANAVELSYGIDERRREQANRIAAAAELDMADWWAPTKDSFFDRVTKSQILAAVVERVSKEAAENITGLKKAAMIAQAADLLASKRWLPIPLRLTCSALPLHDQTT
jgi:ParB family chromosome partitioning protein